MSTMREQFEAWAKIPIWWRNGETYDDLHTAQAWAAWQAATEAAKAESQDYNKPAMYCVPDKDGKPLFGKGWMFSPIPHLAATMPLYTRPAAKATCTADIDLGEDLLPLPEPIEVGGEGWDWEDFQNEKTFSADHMTAYGRACSEAARHDADAAKRLRLICKMVGIESHVPADDETLWGAAFAVLGQIRAALEAARQPAPASEIEPCGGCGNVDPDKRCIGCAHPFRQVTQECTLSEDEIYDIERCIRTGVTMGYTEKKGAEKALAIFKAATNRSQP